MLGESYRPSGLMPWVLNKLSVDKWSFLGCLGTEDRFIAAWAELVGRGADLHSLFVQVDDPPSRFSRQISERLIHNQEVLLAVKKPNKFVNMSLFSSLEHILGVVDEFVNDSTENAIIDVSCLPKRFFFPMIKQINKSQKFRNILLTYTVPSHYTAEALSEDPQPWKELPYFMADLEDGRDMEMALIGVGFLPMGLSEVLVDEYPNIKAKLFFPFPPGLPGYNRNWRFIRNIETSFHTLEEPARIQATDISDIFDHLCSATDLGKRRALLAPYGPKPMSIGFCLYAIETNSPVFYTQPRTYNPNYSVGIASVDGQPGIHAYLTVMGGQRLYKLPQMHI